MTTITNIIKNRMGTTSFDLKMEGMRKPQDFIVYPISANSDLKEIKIQSDKRIGMLDINTGKGKMSQNHASGAYNHHLIFDKMVDFELNATDLEALRTQIVGTASDKAGTNGLIYCDNSNADKI